MHPEELSHQYTYILRFLDKEYRNYLGSVYVRNDGTLDLHGVASGKVPGATADTYRGKWVHISLSVNKNSIKGYWDQYRLFNARFAENATPKAIMFWNCCLPDDRPNIFLLDNVKIAEGAHEVSEEKVLEDGKIITHNILFEVNSAVLLPRSYAQIKRIADLLEKYPDLIFSVEGNTDSDGTETHNQELSEKRAKATIDALVGMGISAERLSYKGLGESEPISDNTTPKGKSQNRRVEFVRVQ